MENKNNFEEESFWEEGNVPEIECPVCGDLNPETFYYCKSCSSRLHDENYNSSFSIMEGESVADKQKTPVMLAKNLSLLRKTLERAERGETTIDEYGKNVKAVMMVAQALMDIFNSSLMKNRVISLPEREKTLAIDTANYIFQCLNGCRMMLEYQGGGDLTAAYEGFSMAENAFAGMDIVMDKTYEVSP